MSTGENLTGAVRRLRSRLGDGPADGELLARYAARRDEAAFAALVRRHGSLVFGVARRQLPDRQQAEDVFQATFLALARSAPRLGGPASLAGWLYAVALRQARKARLRAARRLTLERAVARPLAAQADPLAQISGRELVGLIDEELSRLPEAYRLPLLLCCVQGLSREEAARQLGWSEGAVKGRLERGRRLLAGRLAERDLAPALLLAPLAAAAVPRDLLARAAALAAAPWAPSIPPAVLALAAARAPSRRVAVAALLGSLFAVGLLGLALGPSAGERPKPPAATAAGPEAEGPDDPLPAGSTLRFGTSRFRHGTAIEKLAVEPDGRLAVASSGNHWLGSTRAFDLTTGRVLYTLDANGNFVEAVAFSPDGKALATAQQNTLLLHDPTTGARGRQIELPAANPRTLTGCLAFTPDGKALATTSEGKVVHLIDRERGTVIRSFPHQNAVFTAAFSPDGRLMAAGGYDSAGNGYFARLWEVATGKELRRFQGHEGGIRCLAFSPDGATLASGGDDGRLRLWEVATGKERRALPADGRRVRSVAFTHDGRTVAAAGATIRLYDPATGKERLRIDRQAVGLHFSGDGRTLTGAVAGAIHRWDASTGRPLTPQAAGDSAVDRVAVAPDGRRLVTRDQAGYVHLWDGTTGRHLRRLSAAAYQNGMALSPDGRFVAWSVTDPSVTFKDPNHANWTHEGSRIRLYDLAADRLLDRFPGFAGRADDLAFSRDGRTLVTVDHGDGAVRLWDVAAGKERRAFRAVRDDEKKTSYFVRLTALSPDGRTLAVAHGRTDNTTLLFGAVVVRLWDVTTGKEKHELKGHINQVLGLAFSPDGRLLATCGESPNRLGRGGLDITDRVFVWDVATGDHVTSLPSGLEVGAGSVAFGPDGRTLATASADGGIRLWEVASWQVRAEYRGHRDRVSALAFAADGRLFSASLDTTALAWDVRPRPTADGPLNAAWDDLARPDAPAAFRALGRLRGAPAGAAALLAARLIPATDVSPKRVAELIAELDSPEFDAREKATRELRRLGRQAAAALREAREKSGSAEVRRRAGGLLAELEKSVTPPEELRALRAVEALELLGTPPARRLLAELARGAPGAALTQAAGAALKRLEALGQRRMLPRHSQAT
jgi:RNA polymerase sigma factor (sigma-70 family)